MAKDGKPLYQRDTVLADLRSNVIELQIKGMTKYHLLRLTLLDRLLPHSYNTNQQERDAEQSFHEGNIDMIAAWNVVDSRWVTLNINDVVYCQTVEGYG